MKIKRVPLPVPPFARKLLMSKAYDVTARPCCEVVMTLLSRYVGDATHLSYRRCASSVKWRVVSDFTTDVSASGPPRLVSWLRPSIRCQHLGIAEHVHLGFIDI